MKRFTTPLVASAAAILVAVTFSSTGKATEPASPAQTDRIADSARSLDERISGGALERQAGEYLGWRHWTTPVVACMKKEGFDYALTFVSAWVGFESPGPSAWFVEPGQRSISQSFLRDARTARLRESDEPPKPGTVQATEAYSTAVDTCAKQVGDPLAGTAPVGSEALGAQLTKAVGAFDEQQGDSEGYRTCMSDHGIALAEDAEGWGALYMYVAGKLPRAVEIPLPGEEPSAAWEAFLASEGAALDADADCRTATYLAGVTEYGDLIDEFAAEHAGELDALDTEWSSLVARARAAGWTPQL